MGVTAKRRRKRRAPAVRGWTRASANALLRRVENMFHHRDVEALVSGFTPDCVVRFAEQPERRGRAALRTFLAARLARQKDYTLKKTLMALDADVLANLWEGTWEDAKTGKRMAGRGLEVWRMRDGMIAVWEAAFNVWERDGERTSAGAADVEVLRCSHGLQNACSRAYLRLKSGAPIDLAPSSGAPRSSGRNERP